MDSKDTRKDPEGIPPEVPPRENPHRPTPADDPNMDKKKDSIDNTENIPEDKKR